MNANNTNNTNNDLVTLRIYVPEEFEELRHFYKQRVEHHNEMVSTNKYADSGFDLGLPVQYNVDKHIGFKIPLGIHCSMYKADGTPQGFSLLPRSSIVKTPLRLSNSVGVIDRGYRGPLTAVVDHIKFDSDNYLQLNKLDRYFQVVHPSYDPFKVMMVFSKNELGTTSRDEGGFGSTGR